MSSSIRLCNTCHIRRFDWCSFKLTCIKIKGKKRQAKAYHLMPFSGNHGDFWFDLMFLYGALHNRQSISLWVLCLTIGLFIFSIGVFVVVESVQCYDGFCHHAGTCFNNPNATCTCTVGFWGRRCNKSEDHSSELIMKNKLPSILLLDL